MNDTITFTKPTITKKIPNFKIIFFTWAWVYDIFWVSRGFSPSAFIGFAFRLFLTNNLIYQNKYNAND